MENRFGAKDLVICALLVAVLISVWLSIQAFDRKTEDINIIKQTLRSQTDELSNLHKDLVNLQANGLSVSTRPGDGLSSSTGQGSTGQHSGIKRGDPFEAMKAAEAMPGFAYGDWLIDSSLAPPDRLTPLVSGDTFASEIQSDVLDSLAQRDSRTLDWTPSIATDWIISEDGMTMTFFMRRGVQFSDGVEMTADDVVWTYQWTMNPQVEADRDRAYMSKIKNVEKIDDYTVRFTFVEPYFQSFTLAGGMAILPKHFYSKYSPKQFNESAGLLLGSGPYKLENPTDWHNEPGKPLQLVRNERYWGERPPFDRKIWRIIPDASARLTTFRNGDIDILSPTPEQYRDLLKDDALLKRTQHYEYDAPAGGYRYIGWYEKRAGKPLAFADKRVRQAMTMLIDRENICNNILYGYGTVANGPFSPLSPQNDTTIKPLPYDRDAAIALLKEAGYFDRDGDGVIDGPDGKPFKYELAYPSSSSVLERIALQVKDNMLRAGIDCQPKGYEWSILLERMKARDLDAMMLGWGGTIESDLYQIFHSDQIKDNGDNTISYSNPELDKIIEAARRTVDDDKRMVLWQQAQAILHEDQPYTFLFTSKALVFMDKRLQNVQLVKVGLNPSTEWFVPKDQQEHKQ